jgi:hypothetical protein
VAKDDLSRTAAYLALLAEARLILNRHDPEGLIAAGAPPDEYDDVSRRSLIELQHDRGSDLESFLSQTFQATPGQMTALANDLRGLWDSSAAAFVRGRTV